MDFIRKLAAQKPNNFHYLHVATPIVVVLAAMVMESAAPRIGYELPWSWTVTVVAVAWLFLAWQRKIQLEYRSETKVVSDKVLPAWLENAAFYLGLLMTGAFTANGLAGLMSINNRVPEPFNWIIGGTLSLVATVGFVMATEGAIREEEEEKAKGADEGLLLWEKGFKNIYPAIYKLSTIIGAVLFAVTSMNQNSREIDMKAQTFATRDSLITALGEGSKRAIGRTAIKSTSENLLPVIDNLLKQQQELSEDMPIDYMGAFQTIAGTLDWLPYVGVSGPGLVIFFFAIYGTVLDGGVARITTRKVRRQYEGRKNIIPESQNKHRDNPLNRTQRTTEAQRQEQPLSRTEQPQKQPAKPQPPQPTGETVEKNMAVLRQLVSEAGTGIETAPKAVYDEFMRRTKLSLPQFWRYWKMWKIENGIE